MNNHFQFLLRWLDDFHDAPQVKVAGLVNYDNLFRKFQMIVKSKKVDF